MKVRPGSLPRFCSAPRLALGLCVALPLPHVVSAQDTPDAPAPQKAPAEKPTTDPKEAETLRHRSDHLDTLESRKHFARALQRQGKLAEAETEHRAVVAVLSQVLGAGRFETLDARREVALDLAPQGKHGEAEAEFRALLAIEESVLPATLQNRKSLADTLLQLGRPVDAEAEIRSVLAIREREFAADDARTFAARHTFAKCLRDLGRKADALREAEAAYAAFRKLLGSGNPQPVAAKGLVEELKAAE